jgi:hypothetical protein
MQVAERRWVCESRRPTSLRDSDRDSSANLGLASEASAPVKAIELSGESPVRGLRYRPVAEGNCVNNRKGGEQLDAKEQSVTNVNSIRPSLSGSVLATREPLISRIGLTMTVGQSAAADGR